MQGALGQRIQSVKVADIMDREPPTMFAELKLLDAQEQFFPRYRRPWFAVVDHAATSWGWCARSGSTQRSRRDVRRLRWARCSSRTWRSRIDEQEPLESLLRSEGLGRLGGMVAVDADGVLRGVVTVAQIRQALNPAGGS